jgi:hypothetical protein
LYKSFSIFGVNSNNIEELLSHILNYSFLLPILVILFLSKKISFDKSILVLLTYLVIFFVFNFFFNESKALLGKKNYYFFYTIIEYFSFATIILFCIPEKRFRIIYLISSSAFSIFLILIYSLFKIARLDSIPIGIESIVLMTFVIYYFYFQLKNVTPKSIYEFSSFWFVLGIMIYLGFTFFFNILANSLSPPFFFKYYYYTYLGDILKNLFFSIAIMFASKNNIPHTPTIPKLDLI